MAASLPQRFHTIVIPSSEHDDSEPVKRSLESALVDYARGNILEALQHLRLAAKRAEEAGNDLRAVVLARAAADLATAVSSSQIPPPLSERPTATASAAPASRPSSSDSVLQQLLESGRAVKVVVKRSVRDEGLYVVRRAEAGTSTLGTREAVIVLLDADDSFFASEP